MAERVAHLEGPEGGNGDTWADTSIFDRWQFLSWRVARITLVDVRHTSRRELRALGQARVGEECVLGVSAFN